MVSELAQLGVRLEPHDDQLEVYDEPLPNQGGYVRRSDLGPAATATLVVGAGGSLDLPVASILTP